MNHIIIMMIMSYHCRRWRPAQAESKLGALKHHAEFWPAIDG